MRPAIAASMMLTLVAAPVNGQGLSRIAGPPAPIARSIVPPIVDSRGQRPDAYDDAAEIRDRATAARRADQISRREERRVRNEAGVQEALADRFAVGGLSGSERQELEVRGQVMRDMLNAARSRPRP